MTEKRFYIEDEHIKDNLETHNPFYVETYNEAKRFCELLNDLNQEVIDAEHYHTVVLENFKAISKDYNKLKEENKQLKQFTEKIFTSTEKEIARNEKRIEWEKETLDLLNELLKVNEQLKQQNEFLKKRCDEYWEEAGLNNDYFE